MSLPLLHAGKSAPGLSAALDLRFALDKSLTAYRGPTPSFSRASTGTYFNSSGVLTSAAINAPRFNHTFNGTSWVSRGLLVEEQRTNNCLQSQDLTTTWTTNRGTISANSTNAPDGTLTADRFVENTATGVHGPVQFAITTSNAAANTASGFFKAGSRSVIVIRYQDNATGAHGVGAEFNLSNGTISVAALTVGGFTSPSATITDVGGGWYRCSVTGTANTTLCSLRIETCLTTGVLSPVNFAGSSYTGDGSSYFDSWGYQMEAGSFPTSYIPTTTASVTRSADVCQITGADFSGFWNGTEGTLACEFDRLSSVTSTFSSGFPHAVSLVDSGNLVRQGFYGGHSGASPTGEIFLYNGSGRITAGALVSGTSPIKISGAYKANDFAGSLNGATAVTSSSGSIDPVVQMNIGAWASSQYMLNGHIARLRYFNKRLPNATLQLLSEPDPTLNLQFALNKTLTPVAGPAPSFSRASTGTFFNASGVLTSASINTPRFDHVFTGGQWVSRGLLIEEQRTNLAQYSEDMTSAFWTKSTCTITANNTTAPDGNATADRVVESTGTVNAGVYTQNGISFTNGTTYTASAFVKANGRSILILYFQSSAHAASGRIAWFDIANDTTQVQSGVTASIINVGNGWFRISAAATANATAASGFGLLTVDAMGSINGYTGNGASGFFAWGLSCEAGAFPTSYIGTTSSAVVRSADVCQITGTSFGWMWNQGEGSVASEFDFLAAPADRVSPRVWYASDGAYTNGMWVQSGASDGFYVYQSGSSQAGLTATALGAGVSTKVSSAYKLNDFAASFNGASALTDTTGNVPTVNRMEVGFMSDISGRIINGHIAKLIYYPARLTNTKLQQLST